MQDMNSPRNPRYLSIPTLLAALVSAHVVQGLTAPLELGPILSTIVYLVALATPIILKRAITVDPTSDYRKEDDMFVPRLPTSRFPQVPNSVSRYPGLPLTHIAR
ncbi:MAG: hypothetical protein AAFQ09_12345 [Pseudomonadota bacterium]